MTKPEAGWYVREDADTKEHYWTGKDWGMQPRGRRDSTPLFPQNYQAGGAAPEHAHSVPRSDLKTDPLTRDHGNTLAQHIDAAAYRAAALVLLALAAAFLAVGLVAGVGGVDAGDSAECGSAFSPKDVSSSFELSDTGKDACVREIANAQRDATGWLIAGGLVTLVAAVTGSLAAARKPV